MAVLQSGGQLRAGGDLQPFPRSSVPLSQYGAGGAIELLGDGRTISYADLYRTHLWIAVVINKLSRQIARLPLKTYKRTGNGDPERLRKGRLPSLLAHPFPRGGPTHLKQAIAMPALVNGNSTLRLVRDAPGMPPTRLDPLGWGSMKIIGEPTAPVELWETSQPGQPRIIDPADVLHFAWRGIDGPVGISPLRQLAVTIAIEDAAQRYQKSMLGNSARPETSIELSDAFLGWEPEERREHMDMAREDITFLYGGPDNAGRPWLLPAGMKLNALSHTAVEAELVSQRKLNREEVAACYDVPPPLVALLEKSTFNNITELHRMLYVTVLGPWLDLIEETIQVQLIDPEPAFRGDLYVEFDLSEVLKGDTLQRAQAIALQIGYGVLTIDEARAFENRPRFNLPETTRPLYPANNLKVAGLPTAASDGDVQDAAKAAAAMNERQLARLLTHSGGSVVDAILAMVEDPLAPVLNGHGSLRDQ
jgi:HK97 family phage portal protein